MVKVLFRVKAAVVKKDEGGHERGRRRQQQPAFVAKQGTEQQSSRKARPELDQAGGKRLRFLGEGGVVYSTPAGRGGGELVLSAEEGGW